MCKYYSVIGKHYLKEVNDNQHYLSLKIQNEFNHILGNHVKENIIDRIRKANYFVITLDSIPNISPTDPLSFICRYVVVEDKGVKILESFLGFITEHGKLLDIKKMILHRLEKESF